MPEEMQDKKSSKKATQAIIRVREVRDGIAIFNDNTMRSTLMVSSINFALKSEEEQNAIIFAYQDYINALDFPLEITVSSRRLDIKPYLEQVKVLRDKQQNDLLRLQMDEYINFVADLVKNSDIMTKTFFITIPFSVQENTQVGLFTRLRKGAQEVAGGRTMSDAEFEHNRSQLMQRVSQIASGLRNIGLRAVPLQTQEVVELLYTMYNPQTSHNQRLQNVASLKVEETEPAPEKVE